MRIRLERREETLFVHLHYLDEAGRPVNTDAWDWVALDADGQRIELSPRQTGLGRYTAEVPLEDRTNLGIRLHDTARDRFRTATWVRGYPEEYRLSRAPADAVAALPGIAPRGIRDNIDQRAVSRDASAPFILSAMGLFLAGLVLRRV